MGGDSRDSEHGLDDRKNCGDGLDDRNNCGGGLDDRKKFGDGRDSQNDCGKGRKDLDHGHEVLDGRHGADEAERDVCIRGGTPCDGQDLCDVS